MRPRRLVDEPLQELRRRDRAAITAAGILHVGEFRIDHLVVFRRERHAPDLLAGGRAGLGQPLGQPVVVGEQAGIFLPERCALPSGMFSTSPMAPIAFTLALRAASACISPTTQAAPAMSPFMSSMLAAGLIEIPPVSKHTPLPMKASGAVPF